MEVLELRTYRDLQYVRGMETLMRSLDARLRAADGSLSAKSFQVGPGRRGLVALVSGLRVGRDGRPSWRVWGACLSPSPGEAEAGGSL